MKIIKFAIEFIIAFIVGSPAMYLTKFIVVKPQEYNTAFVLYLLILAYLTVLLLFIFSWFDKWFDSKLK